MSLDNILLAIAVGLFVILIGLALVGAWLRMGEGP